MGHSFQATGNSMRVGFVIAIFSTLALAQDCPDNPPITCGTDQMVCHGGFDPAGCPMPDTCTPMTGPIGNDGTQCPGFCPHVCPADHTQCPMTSPNGCMVADSCMPMTYGHDGAQCPGMCPIQCPEDHMHCGGGMDAAGCPMPDTCVSMTEECPTIVEPAPVCENIHADNKCIKNKNKGKCGKKWMKKKCKKECGYC